MKRIASLVLKLAAVYGFSVGGLHGQFMLSPVNVTESGLGTFGPTTGLTNMINQSGLAASPFVSGVTSFDEYFTPNNKYSQNLDGTKWQSVLSFDQSITGHLDFDLGASFRIFRLAIWNVSVRNLTVLVAESPAALDTASSAGTFTLANNTSSVSLQANLLDLENEVQGRYVRLLIESEYPYFTDLFYATIGEVVVSALPAGSVNSVAITRESNGDVTVAFTGTLQSKTAVADQFQDVPGNPQGSHTIPRASLGMRRLFRSRN
jgi:hypothetical protein